MSNVFIVGAAAAGGGPTVVAVPVIVQAPSPNIPPTASTASKAYSSNVKAGSTLITCVSYRSAAITITSVKDNLNAPNWTLAGVVKQGNGLTTAIYYYQNTLAGACTVTITVSASATLLEITVTEVKGLTGVVDVTSADSNTTTGVITPGILTTTAAKEFLIAYDAVTSSTTSNTSAPGWTISVSGSSGSGSQFTIGITAGSYNPVFSVPSTWSAVAAAFFFDSTYHAGIQGWSVAEDKKIQTTFALSSFDYSFHAIVTSTITEPNQIQTTFAFSSFNYVQNVQTPATVTESNKIQATFALSSFNYA